LDHIWILGIVIFLISITMASVGKGGGNFYVLAMVISGTSIFSAATTSQLIMFGTALTATLVFSNNKKVDWKLTFIIGPTTFLMAFVGGYFANVFEGNILKIGFAVGLFVISIVMLIKVKEKEINNTNKTGYLLREINNYKYTVNLWIAIPSTAVIGLFSGAVGISGGSFIIPLMVMAFGIPMEIAIGTSITMVTATALMGFLGHTVNGDFDLSFAIPLVVIAIVGGLIGSKFSVKSKPKNLKLVFAATNLLAAVLMIYNIIYS